jgi:hypothetical protein
MKCANSIDRNAVERQLLLTKFEQSVKDQNRVTEEDYKRSVSKMLLRQIVIRPKLPAASEKNFQATQEKNVAAARQKIDALAAQLKRAQPKVVANVFTGIAKAQSDDAATKAKGGLVGWKLPTELTVGAPIKQALTAATTTPAVVGPLQDEVTRDFYLFLIENRRPELPKDYAKNKTQLLKDFETQRDNEVWAQRREEIRTGLRPRFTTRPWWRIASKTRMRPQQRQSSKTPCAKKLCKNIRKRCKAPAAPNRQRSITRWRNSTRR